MKRTICFILVFMFIISAVSVFAVESNNTDIENTIDEGTQISEQLLTDERAAQLINALVYIKENLNDKEYKKALTYIGYTEDELNVTGNITDDGYFNTGLNYNDFNTRMSSLFSDSVRKQIIDDLTIDIDGLLGVKIVEDYNVPSSFRIINQGQNDNLYSFYIKYLIQNNQEISIIIEIEDIDAYDLFELIGRRRGFLLRGGVINERRTAEMLLDEFRLGTVGRITLESPKEN